MIGRFEEVRAKTRQIGEGEREAIPNLFELVLSYPGEEEAQLMRAMFFGTSYGGRQSRPAECLEAIAPVAGEWLVARIKVAAKPSKDGDRAYLNEDVLTVHRLAELMDDAQRVVTSALTNGSSNGSVKVGGTR